jgi:flavorubredoxin
MEGTSAMHTTSADVRDPYQVATDTWVVPELVPGPPGTVVTLNSMVIAGAEPVIVDTGNALSRTEWLDAAFSIVEPRDVRWIFPSHDDHDHSGNLAAVLDLCRDATLVTTQFTVERMVRAEALPFDRTRWVNSGESFDAGDRTLVAMRPPVFDSPVTRGLFDTSTGVYWAVDTFAAPMPGHLEDVADMPAADWAEMLLLFNRMVSPWLTLVDQARFDAYVDQVEALGATTVTSGHSAALRGDRLAEAFRLVRTLPSLPAAPLLGQDDLDAILAAHLGAGETSEEAA